jgi:PD-(D/E)XK nuclease superfamily protein
MGNSVRKSPTALKQFEFCERQFYYQRIQKLPEPPSLHLVVGILYHTAIERLVRAGTVSRTEVQLMIEELRKGPGWCDPGKSDEELCEEVMHAMVKVGGLVDALPVAKGPRGPRVEEWGERYTCKIDYISTRLPVVKDGELVGVEPGLCVLDWKTVGGKRRRGQDDVDHSPQLALYCIETGAHHAAFVEIPRDSTQPLNIVAAEFTDLDLRRWGQFLDAQFGAMQSRGPDESQFKLAERGHPLCSPRFCPYWSRCPGGAA